MWFKENKACNFSLNCPLWFWFFFLPVTIKEFCSNVDTQGRNSLKSSSISCSCLNNFWDAVVSGGFFFFLEGGWSVSWQLWSRVWGLLLPRIVHIRLSYRISKGLNAFSLQKPFDLSLGKSKREYNWLGRTGYSVLFENYFPSSHNKLIS